MPHTQHSPQLINNTDYMNIEILNDIKDSNEWKDRNDVLYNMECYHIDNDFYSHKMNVYFEFFIISNW